MCSLSCLNMTNHSFEFFVWRFFQVILIGTITMGLLIFEGHVIFVFNVPLFFSAGTCTLGVS